MNERFKMTNTEKNAERRFHWKFTDSKKVLRYAVISLVVLLLLHVIVYFGFFNSIPNFIAKFGWWILYLDISVATLGGALWYYASYKGYTSCMASMMIGMTLGMQTGMMLGAVFGAVNGFFIGSMVGMILGTFVGLMTGSTSVMGTIQGAMSGLMGGTIGAMITVMMFTDHVSWFMPFYMIINVAILAGFVFMYYDEVIKDNNEIIKKDIDLLTFVSLCIVAGFLFTILLVYGPKSFVFGALSG